MAKGIAAHAALKNNEPARRAEIIDLKKQIMKLLKRGEVVFISDKDDASTLYLAQD